MDIMTFAIAAVLVLVLAGVLIGLFFALRGGQNKPPAQQPAAGRPDLVEIARLERDRETNMLMVVVDGKLYASASNLSLAQRQKLASASIDMHKWLGLPAAAASSSAPAVYTPPPSVVPPAVQAVADEVIPPPIKPVSTNPVDALRHTMGTNKPVASFKSIPAQIDEILQGKLAGTPLEKRNIHLTESASEGVVVQVGLDQYPGIDAVPDEEVRNLIRSAVAEWEKRNR